MKDYSVLEGLIKNIKFELQTAYNKGYERGFVDGMYEICETLKKINAEWIVRPEESEDDEE